MLSAKHYRECLVRVTDDDLRYEFLRLLAQDGRDRLMSVIAEQGAKSSADYESAGLTD